MGELDGYVKLYRQLLGSEEWCSMTPGCTKVMVGAILLANWRDVQMVVGGQAITIPRGSFLSSVRKLAKLHNLTEKTVRVAIGYLVDSGFMSLRRAHLGAHAGTIFTVGNYCKYQDSDPDRGTVKGTPCGPEGTPCGPEGTPCGPEGTRSIYEEVEEGKKGKAQPSASEAFTTADFLRTQIVKAKPNHRLSKESYYKGVRDSWAQELDRAHRIDGRSWRDLCRVAKWACADPFWQPNIQSAKKLRDKFDTLEAQMERPASGQRQGEQEPLFQEVNPNE